MSVVTGFIGGIAGYFAGSKVGDAIYSAGKKICGVAKTVANVAWNGLKSAGRSIANGVKKIFSKIFG